ncbi:DUF6297 family protein [Nocardioides sp.]|uniref:DUF6297 family protein n=1 Tax=Nocardioides sp. TaxID=35761 RepID=UPI003D0E07FF
MTALPHPTARELRGDIRHWRRGRAQARLRDVLEDAYVALFATLMLSAILVNVIRTIGQISDTLCTSPGCLGARALLPYLVTTAALALVLSGARLFGPVFVPPAVGSWLLSSPVDRRSLLRPRLVGTLLVALVASALVSATGSVLGGLDPLPLVALDATTAVLATATVALATVDQTRRGRTTRVAAGVIALALWAGLLITALGLVRVTSPTSSVPSWWWIALAAAVAITAVAIQRAMRALARLRQRQITPGGALVPSLSGALAGLDLALVNDVLLAHRWRSRGSVRSRRGGSTGPGALMWPELTRMLRSPQQILTVCAVVVAPYAAATAGAGRGVIVIGGLAGFFAALPTLTGLRVLERTPGIRRNLPFTNSQIRRAALVVPTALMWLYGLAIAPAVHEAVGEPVSQTLLLGVAVGFASLTAAVRWMTGRPPDYSKPLVSTPAGGVPTNLYGSVVRGMDVLLLTLAPMLLSPSDAAAWVSILLSFAILAYLVSRD